VVLSGTSANLYTINSSSTVVNIIVATTAAPTPIINNFTINTIDGNTTIISFYSNR